MAEKNTHCGYVGRVPSAGAAAVKAPHQSTVKKSPAVHRGTDLRSGKRQGK